MLVCAPSGRLRNAHGAHCVCERHQHAAVEHAADGRELRPPCKPAGDAVRARLGELDPERAAQGHRALSCAGSSTW